MYTVPPSDAGEEALRFWAGGLLIDEPENPAPPVTDTGLIEKFARRHGIAQLLAPRVPVDSAAGRALPEEAITARHIALEMARHEEFLTIARALAADSSLAPIVIKGQALAHTLYPGPWMRSRDDVDVLLERRSVETMADLLREHGYRRLDAIDGELVMRQAILTKRAHGMTHMWDIHWSVSNRPAFAQLLPYRKLRETARETFVDGIRMLTPDIVDSLLIACLHLVGHHAGAPRLIWLYDIHMLAATLNTADSERFLREATSLREVRGACHASLALTGRYLPSAHTDALCRALDPGRRGRWRVNRNQLSGLAADVRGVGRGNRLRFIAQHVFPSSDYMIRRFGIRRRWQLPFWYTVRVARAIPKLFRRR